MTTRAWAKAHYDAGTNRRAVVFAIQEFLCLPIDSWKVAGLPDNHVGRDIDRNPGKDPMVYQSQCKTCHSGMDAMRGAFAQYDYINDSLVELPQNIVVPKYARGSKTYEAGHVTKDDAWSDWLTTYLNVSQSATIETKDIASALSAGELVANKKGINQFGQMLSSFEAFKTCMATRVFAQVCQREVTTQDQKDILAVSQKFGSTGYNLKRLFQDVAVLPSCVGN